MEAWLNRHVVQFYEPEIIASAIIPLSGIILLISVWYYTKLESIILTPSRVYYLFYQKLVVSHHIYDSTLSFTTLQVPLKSAYHKISQG
jgi:hypothetical protein